MSEPLFDDTDELDDLTTKRTLEFSDYPKLTDLIFAHTPGYNYLIGLATNVAKFHAGGWRQVNNRDPFLIRGEAFLLFRKGSPIWGGNSGDNLPEVTIDSDADRVLGLATPGRLEGPKIGERPTSVGQAVDLSPEEPEGEPMPLSEPNHRALAPALAPALAVADVRGATPQGATPLRKPRPVVTLADSPTPTTLHMPTKE